MKRLFPFEINRDTNYYFGMALFVLASLSILWAIVRDAFDPKDFLIYFLVYAWGYVLVLKSDFELRTGQMEKALIKVEERLARLEQNKGLVYAQETPEQASEEEDAVFSPGLSVDGAANPEPRDIYHEW